MKQPLEAALEELALSTLLSARQVKRVDVDDAGGLHLCVLDGGTPRWFTFDDRGLTERQPRSDDALPLARKLSGQERVLSYRPSRRVVVEHETSRGRWIVKGYRPGSSDKAARRHRAAEQALRGSAFRVAPLRAHNRSDEALVFEPLDGQPLWFDRDGIELCRKLGAALAAFQTAAVEEELGVFGSRDELGVLERWCGKAERALGELPPGWKEAFARAGELVSELPEPTLGLTHRDLHDGQCLETSDGLALLDFDQLARADVALDPANFLAHLALRALQGERGAEESSSHACGEALLAGLGRNGEAFWTWLRFYEATTFLRLALIYALRPRWMPLAPKLVRYGERCIEDLIRTG